MTSAWTTRASHVHRVLERPGWGRRNMYLNFSLFQNQPALVSMAHAVLIHLISCSLDSLPGMVVQPTHVWDVSVLLTLPRGFCTTEVPIMEPHLNEIRHRAPEIPPVLMRDPCFLVMAALRRAWIMSALLKTKLNTLAGLLSLRRGGSGGFLLGRHLSGFAVSAHINHCRCCWDRRPSCRSSHTLAHRPWRLVNFPQTFCF